MHVEEEEVEEEEDVEVEEVESEEWNGWMCRFKKLTTPTLKRWGMNTILIVD